MGTTIRLATVCAVSLLASGVAHAQLAIKGRVVWTMAGGPGGNKIESGVVLIGADGKITGVGPAATTPVPTGWTVIEAAVVTPGLIDARGTVGVSGIFNQRQDQDQLEHSAAIQPELRGIDAYNPNDPLVEWLRSLGVTTVHTGHAPGELISGQTCIVKTVGRTVEEALVKDAAMVACTLGPGAQRDGGSPGTRGKMVAMLREQFIKAREYLDKADKAKAAKPADGAAGGAAGGAPGGEAKDKDKGEGRNLRLETLGRVLKGELPLLVTAQRAQDIASALRLAEEFKIRLVLDGASESPLLLEEIKKAGVPVIVHPTMTRAYGEAENLSLETAATLAKAGITEAIESGYEGYVPKTRVVLLEAGVAAANGLGPEGALAAITVNTATILGIADRVGSLKPGMDGDVALFDGDPLEYTTHCVGTVINGKQVSSVVR